MLLTVGATGGCSKTNNVSQAKTTNNSYSMVVGKRGGTVGDIKSVAAAFPKDALPGDEEISIRPAAEGEYPELPANAAGDVYSFEPHGLRFDLEVDVYLPRPGSGDYTIWHAAPGGSWEDLGRMGAQKSTSIHTKTLSFSYFVTVREPEGGGGSGGSAGAGTAGTGTAGMSMAVGGSPTGSPSAGAAVGGRASAGSGPIGPDPSGGEGPLLLGGAGMGGEPGIGGTGTSMAGMGAGGEGTLPVQAVPLDPVDGWVSADSNSLKIQGSIFPFADTTTDVGMMTDFAGGNACIQGSAAKVNLACTPVAPATNCYAQYWGAAIGLNLNETQDMDPLPFDASRLVGFSFSLSGPAIPSSLRFRLEDASGVEYCTTKRLVSGTNTVQFDELWRECWDAPGASAVSVKAKSLRIAWHVVTNESTVTPFDFCVTGIKALEAPPSN